MTADRSLVQRREAVVARGVPRLTDVVVNSAAGVRLETPDGVSLLDFAGGIGVMNVGHCHPRVVSAIQDQAARLLHTCIHIATYEPYVALCEKLVEVLPHGGPTKALLVNSGAEAVENAVKIARQATGRQGILCFSEGFHGRTLLGMTLTSKVGYKMGCGPFAPEVYRLPFPNHYRYGDGLSLDAFVEREIGRLREGFTNLVAADQLAAVLIEPVQGEGGFVPAPLAYLQELRRVCDEHGVLLICDEVQSGFCRTGRWASYEHYGIVPDLSTWAKSMGGGLPIGAVLGKAAVMDAARPGTIGGTYGGNPVACAGALATIQVMEDEGLAERAMQIGATVRRRFEEMAQRHPSIGDVRGLGAMIAMELVTDRKTKEPAAKLTASVVARCAASGVLVIPAGTHSNVIRILCPLVIEDSDLQRGLDIIDETISSVTSASTVRI